MHCIINETENYIEELIINPIDALPNHHQILIKSQLLDAKNPTALQTHYRSTVSTAELRELRDILNAIVD
jgi:hypothetical protein